MQKVKRLHERGDTLEASWKREQVSVAPEKKYFSGWRNEGSLGRGNHGVIKISKAETTDDVEFIGCLLLPWQTCWQKPLRRGKVSVHPSEESRKRSLEHGDWSLWQRLCTLWRKQTHTKKEWLGETSEACPSWHTFGTRLHLLKTPNVYKHIVEKDSFGHRDTFSWGVGEAHERCFRFNFQHLGNDA